MDGALAKSESNRDGESRRVEIKIAAEDFVFHPHAVDDRKVRGEEVLKLFGADPPDAYLVLHHLPSGELETLRPAEAVGLENRGVSRFFVLEGADSHRFKVDLLSMEWPKPTLTGRQVKFLAHAGDDQDLVRLGEGGEEIIEDDETVTLSAAGLERFALKKAKKTVTVTFNDVEFELERRRWTTEELIAEFKVTAGYVLDLIEADGEFRQLKPGESLKLREGMAFTAHPPCGHSS